VNSVATVFERLTLPALSERVRVAPSMGLLERGVGASYSKDSEIGWLHLRQEPTICHFNPCRVTRGKSSSNTRLVSTSVHEPIAIESHFPHADDTAMYDRATEQSKVDRAAAGK
jgi:hypothetical protein